MHPTLALLRIRMARASAAAVVAIGAAGLLPVSAIAQIVPGTPDKVFSSGPFQLRDGETLTFGMLLPAIQRARTAALFTLTDSQGVRIFTYPPDPGRMSRVTVTFHANATGGQRGASFEVNNGIGNPNLVPAGADGILIGLLLPAVDRSGQSVGPLAASMQSTSAAGVTMTHSPMISWVAPGPPD